MDRPAPLRRFPVSLLLMGLAAGACEDSPVDEGAPPPVLDRTSCSAAGTVHAGEIGSETWTVEDSPHHLRDSVTVGDRDSLVVQAGALVCADAGVALTVDGRLFVRGTADRPVTFTATDTAAGWEGLRERSGFRGEGTIHHALVEHARKGISWHNEYGHLLVEDTRIRRTVRAGIELAFGRVVRTVLDTTCTASCKAAFEVLGNSTGTAEVEADSLVVRGSGADGVLVSERNTLSLGDVLIEGSAGVGLVQEDFIPFAYTESLVIEGEVRITGGGSYPAVLQAPNAFPILEGAAAERLRGNARDTLVVVGGLADGPFEPAYPFRIAKNTSLRGLVLEAGAYLPLDARLSVSDSLVIEGTPERPVTVAGGTLRAGCCGEPSDTAVRVAHLVLRGTDFATQGPDALLESLTAVGSRVELERSAVVLAAKLDGSTLVASGAGTRIHDAEVTAAPGDGIALSAPDALLTNCRVTGSEGAGIVVLDGEGVRIHGCDLVDNAGPGVAARGPRSVDARGNWWGDPDGPTAPAGDGVEGPVIVHGHLSAPARAGDAPGAPASISLAGPLSVRVGLSALLEAVAVDGDGVPLPLEPLVWRVADTAVAHLPAPPPRILVGRSRGATELTVMVASDTTIRTTVTVTVEGGGPDVHWTFGPALPGDRITGAWGRSATDLFAVGHPEFEAGRDAGVTIRWNGHGWNRGRGPDMFAVFGNEDGVWATDYFVDLEGGREGTGVFELQGNEWWKVVAWGTRETGHDLWISDDGETFLSGPRVVRREGEGLEDLEAPRVCYHAWGRSATELYAACDGTGHLLDLVGVALWNGSDWRVVGEWGDGPAPHDVWASDDYVYAVGREGVARRWDGERWEDIDTGLTQDLWGLHGTSDSNLYAVGDDGVLIHWDGREWSRLWLPVADPRLSAVWATDGAVLVVGVGLVLLGRPVG